MSECQAGDYDQSSISLIVDQVRRVVARTGPFADPALLRHMCELGLTGQAAHDVLLQWLTPEQWRGILHEVSLLAPAAAAAIAIDCRVPLSIASNSHDKISEVLFDWPLKCSLPLLPIELAADMQIVIAASLRRLAVLAEQHALERPMFGRHLGDFQHIRLRLLRLHIQALLAEYVVAVGGPDRERSRMSVLAQLVEAVRNQAQQIGGGSAFMREGVLAREIKWLDTCLVDLMTWNSQPVATFSPDDLRLLLGAFYRWLSTHPDPRACDLTIFLEDSCAPWCLPFVVAPM